MATLDQDDLDNIRLIVQDELKNDANINSYISKLDATISSRSVPNDGLTIDEHNHLMTLQNTDVAENTKLSRITLALSTKNKRRR